MVLQTGQYFDPCYRLIHQPIEGMALGRLIGHTRRTAGAIPASKDEADTKYEVADINNVNYFFRILSDPEMINGLQYEMLAVAPPGNAIGDSTH